MNKKQYKKNFTPSDDALIREQPVTGIGLNLLATTLRTSRDTVMRRADQLAFRWSSAMTMTSLSTRERFVVTTDSSTRY